MKKLTMICIALTIAAHYVYKLVRYILEPDMIEINTVKGK